MQLRFYGTPWCLADFNLDGMVNTLDMTAFLSAYSAVPPKRSADYTGNGVVDTQDFLAFLNEWNAGCD